MLPDMRPDDPTKFTSQTPQNEQPLNIPPGQPGKKGRLNKISRILTVTLILVIFGLILLALYLSTVGSGGEIVFIVVAPLFLMAIFGTIIAKFIISSIRLRRAQKNGEMIQPGKRKRMLAGWLILGTLTIIGILFIANYIRVTRATRPHVNEQKSITYISECKVTGIQQDGLGDGKSIVINLDSKLPEATDAYGGINYFIADASDWDSLVAAVKSAEPKCGRISAELSDKNTRRYWLSYDNALNLLGNCLITETVAFDNPESLAYQITKDWSNLPLKDNTGIVIKDAGTFKVLYADTKNFNSLKQYVESNQEGIKTKCGNERYGDPNPFLSPATD